METEQDRDHRILQAMARYGGSFVKILAELAMHADPINFIKIKTTWSGYWGKYERMSRPGRFNSHEKQ